VVVRPEAVLALGALVAAGASRRRRLGTITADDVAVVEVFRCAVAANERMSSRGRGTGRTLDHDRGPAATWATVNTTAAVLGISTRHVRRLAQAGVFPGAALVGRDWRIPSAAVALAATHNKELH